MEDDEDDMYAPEDTVQTKSVASNGAQKPVTQHKVDTSDEGEEDDSDDEEEEDGEDSDSVPISRDCNIRADLIGLLGHRYHN